MTEAKWCDMCGSVSTVPLLLWYHVERTVVNLTDPVGGWDFDRAECLSQWAALRTSSDFVQVKT